MMLIENPAPPGKRGWPWEIPDGALSNLPLQGQLPTLSVVVVSFNQAAYLEEALRSLLLQEYPHLEVFVADGGSRDGSVEIIRRYEPWLAGWFSEPDRGQSDALNKGFKRVSGEICNWLCSDDLLLPGALRHIGEFFRDHPSVDVLAGSCRLVNERYPDKSRDAYITQEDLGALPARNRVFQPCSFFRRKLLTPAEPLRADLHYTMDWELWCRFLELNAKWAFTRKTLGIYRLTGKNKGQVGGIKVLREIESIYREYSHEWLPLTFWFRYFWLPLVRHSRKPSGGPTQRISRLSARVLCGLLKVGYRSRKCDELRSIYRFYGLQ